MNFIVEIEFRRIEVNFCKENIVVEKQKVSSVVNKLDINVLRSRKQNSIRMKFFGVNWREK